MITIIEMGEETLSKFKAREITTSAELVGEAFAALYVDELIIDSDAKLGRVVNHVQVTGYVKLRGRISSVEAVSGKKLSEVDRTTPDMGDLVILILLPRISCFKSLYFFQSFFCYYYYK